MVIYLFLTVILLVLTLELFILWRRHRQLSKRDSALIASEWLSIQEKLYRSPKHALLEADKLLDFVLKKRGYHGGMADKLRKAEKAFSHKEHVWEAHKLRNRAAHEVGFDLTEDEARKTISYIKQALWELGVKL